MWWKSPQLAGQPQATLSLNGTGWVRFDLFQQRTGGITAKTIVDVHTGEQDRTSGLHDDERRDLLGRSAVTVSASVPSGASSIVTTNADSYATSSWTGAGATRTYICFAATGGTALRNGSVTGNGLTWTEIGTRQTWDSIASATRQSQMFRARGTASTGATTYDCGAGTDMNGIVLVVVELDGVDGTTNQGVVQSVNTPNDSSASPHTLTLSSFASSTNATLACFIEDVNSAPTVEGGGAWSSLASGTYSTPNTGALVEFRASADTSPSCGATTVAWSGMAVELAELTGGVDATASPGVLAASFTIPAVASAGGGDATASPGVIARSFTVPQATATGDPTSELIVRAEEATAVDGSTMTTASVTISGDGSIISVFHGYGSGAANTPTVSGWTLMNASAPAGARSVSTFYRAGTYSGTATIDWGGQTQTFRGYCFSDAFGYDFSSLEVQEDSVSHTSSTVTTTSGDPLALSTFAASDHTTYFALLHGGSSANLATFDAGMAELMNRDIGAESMSCGVAWMASQDLQPDASWTNAGHYTGHAFELRKSSGAVDATATPGVVAVSAAIPQVVASASSSVTPTAIGVSLVPQNPGAQASSNVTPAVIAQPFALPQATASGGGSATVNPDVIARSLAVPQASPQASSTVEPGVVSRSLLIPQVSVTAGGSATAFPEVIARSLAIPQADPRAGVSITPAVLARSLLVPQAAASGGTDASRTPALISRSLVIPQMSLILTAAPTPATLAMLMSFPQTSPVVPFTARTITREGPKSGGAANPPPKLITKEGTEPGGAASGGVKVVSREG